MEGLEVSTPTDLPLKPFHGRYSGLIGSLERFFEEELPPRMKDRVRRFLD
jgi:hypothetical protein